MRQRRRYSTLIPLVILFAWLIFLRPTFLYGNTSYIIVMGKSMEPTLKQGDLVILKRANSYSVGDILSYISPHGPIIIHRVVGLEDGAFILKGDNHTSVDPWPVTQDMTLGRLVFSIPRVGATLSSLKNPLRMATVISSLFFFSVPLSDKPEKKRPKPRSTLTLPTWLSKRIMILIPFIALLALSGYGVFHVQRLPTENTRFVEQYTYGHVGNFDYTVELTPNILYNKTTIGPGEAIYLSLARVMDIRFDYEFNCTSPADVSGTYSVYMDLELPEEWMRRFTITSDVPIGSNGFTFSHQLNITSINQLIKVIEEETANRASVYELKIIPEIHIVAEVEGDTVEEDISPSMVITFTRNRLTVEGLSHNQPKTIGQMEVEPATRNMLGKPILVIHLRYLSYMVLAAFSMATAYVSYYVWSEPISMTKRIKRKYGKKIVESSEPVEQIGKVTIKVDAIDDLAKVAEEAFKPIIHNNNLFYVLDGEVRYEFHMEN